jgi:hypothetical protein
MIINIHVPGLRQLFLKHFYWVMWVSTWPFFCKSSLVFHRHWLIEKTYQLARVLDTNVGLASCIVRDRAGVVVGRSEVLVGLVDSLQDAVTSRA